MIEIGKNKTIRLVTGFGKHAKPVLDDNGKPITKTVPDTTWRVTRGKLDGHFCRDRNRRLIVGLLPGDVLSLRPEGRLRRTTEVTIELKDVYSYCLRCKALSKQLEKARTKKVILAARRERRSIKRAEKRLTQD